MKVRNLKNLIDRHENKMEEDVKVVMSVPSVGGKAISLISNAHFGFDWDRGLLLTPEESLVPKTNNQSIFEAANDLLMMLATECFVLKRLKYENKRAAKILIKYGYTKEELEKYVSLYHKNLPIINTLEEVIEKKERL